MSEPLIQINISNSNYNMDEDLVEIRFRDENVIQINFVKLFAQSKYFRDKYKYSEAINYIQEEIEKIEEDLHISNEIIKFFFQLIQEEEVNIPLKHYNDFYKLSEYFCTQKITTKLDNISQKEILNDLNFTIQILLDSDTAKSSLETKLSSKIENFLVERVNDCFNNLKFNKLPMSTICRIFDKSKEIVSHDLLVDFILKSATTRFILFKYVELHKMKDDKVKELIEFIEKQDEEKKKMYLEYIPFNLLFIKRIINKYDEVLKENNQLKEKEQKSKEASESSDDSNLSLDEEHKYNPQRGHLKIHVVNGKKLRKMDPIGKSDPYMTFELKDHKGSKVKTNVIENNLSPVWNEDLVIDIPDIKKDVLLVNLWDEDIKNDYRMMNEQEIHLNTIPIGQKQVFNEGIKFKKKDAGNLHYEYELLEGPAPQQNTMKSKPCIILVHAIKAEKLGKMFDNLPDSYLTLQIKGESDSIKRTRTIDNDRNPVWNEKFEYHCKDWNSDVLVLNLSAENIRNDDMIMNEIEFPLKQWPIGTHIDYQEDIKLKKKNAGRLYLKIDVLDEIV